MKLSEKTFEILKAFSGIQDDLYIQPGNVLTSRKKGGRIQGTAISPETFPVACGISPLTTFINVAQRLENPEITWEKEKVVLTSEDGQQAFFRYTDGNNIVSKANVLYQPDQPGSIVTQICKEQVYRLMNVAGILKLNLIKLVGDGEKITVHAVNEKTKPKNGDYSSGTNIVLGPTDKTFRFDMPMESFNNLMKRDYQISINRLSAHFVAEDVQYWITSELSSRSEWGDLK